MPGQARSVSGVPVFLYHGITRQRTSARIDRFCITAEDFGAQLAHLKRAASVKRLDQMNRHEVGDQPRKVVITFDDGVESDFTLAFPILRAAGVTAHFFINTANVGTRGYMGWSQIRSLHGGGMQIGSHGHRHIDLSRLASPVLKSELESSRKALEDNLQVPVESFATPYGLITKRLLHAAHQAGYRTVCSSVCKLAASDRSPIPRVAISRTTSIDEFKLLVSGDRFTYWTRNVAAAGKYLPRQIVMRLRPELLGIDVAR